MTETDASARVRAALPRGLVDRNAADIAAAEAMMARIREVYRLYGFEAAETPFIEYTDALGKFLPDQDRPNEGVFSFRDDDGQWLSLRYDLTAPLARLVAENYDRLPKPYRSYRAGSVFRNEKPGPGRFRQFMQFDADTVGAASVAADAEICMMAADCMEALGIKRGQYVIKFSNKKLYEGLQVHLGLGGTQNAARRLIALRAIDKYERIGMNGVRELLGDGRTDASGDVTKGAQLKPPQIEANVAFLALTSNQSKLAQNLVIDTAPPAGAAANASTQEPNKTLSERHSDDLSRVNEIEELTRRIQEDTDLQGVLNDPLFSAGLAEIGDITHLVRAAGYGEDRIRFDSSVVRGLEYYTGPVFEAELTFATLGDEGRPVRFGSVGGGGRYDGLVARFRAEPVPATGFSIGVSRLLAALRAIDSPIVAYAETPGPVVVLALDRDPQAMANYQRLVASLRAAGVASELYLGAGGMNAQLKYADRRMSRVAVIQGSNERDAPGGPRVTIRDLKLGAELAKSTKDRADYLELRQCAQSSWPEAELVARVREALARDL